jgi:NCS1 family nucleobase:cation symporter-1
LIALVLGVAPNVPGFLKAAGFVHGSKNFFDAIYVYAWFTGVFIAGAVYFALMLARAPTGARSAPR